MTLSQRKKILQILYDGRARPYRRTLDRAALIQQMAIPWEDFQHEIDYLRENGFIEIIHTKIGSRFFESFQITTTGIDAVERTPSNTLLQQHADVLLVTVTEIETKAVLNLFSEIGKHFIGDKTYYDLGEVGEARIFLVQSEMGSGGPSGSLLTIEKSIQSLSPSAIVMVGLAFGINPGKQRIGEILVSKQILDYELQRISKGPNGEFTISPRADRPSPPSRMLDRFRDGAKDWKAPPAVEFGLLLSGAKLVDHQDFRDQLQKLEPEAIGGEMEGAGLYAAAQRNKTDWIVVKAICDWADGNKNRNKDQRQRRAADNAARFTIHVIQQGGFKGLQYQAIQRPINPNNQRKTGLHGLVPQMFSGPASSAALLQSKIKNNEFDVFLCYNSEDRAEVKTIGEALKYHGILPWFDEWELIPGLPWQRALETQIQKIKSAAVFVGKAGMGPWHSMEMEALLRQFVRRNCSVIPVLLPATPANPQLPLFLEGMTWVDFRKQDPDPMERLIWGITGKPGSYENIDSPRKIDR